MIVTSETAGRLLGLATASPETVEVVADLLSFGSGLDIDEREVTPAEIGHDVDALGVPVMAVVRQGTLLLYHHPDIGTMRAGDRIIHALAVSHEPALLPGEWALSRRGRRPAAGPPRRSCRPGPPWASGLPA